jgi:hypothetical protein
MEEPKLRKVEVAEFELCDGCYFYNNIRPVCYAPHKIKIECSQGGNFIFVEE